MIHRRKLWAEESSNKSGGKIGIKGSIARSILFRVKVTVEMHGGKRLIIGASITLCVLDISRAPVFINPLRPNNDLSQTSHCNIKGVSVSEVMRIENKITPVKFY